MNIAEIYMASPDWIKALMIMAPCLTVLGCVFMISSRWPRREIQPPAAAEPGLLYAEPENRRQAGEWLLETLEHALAERRGGGVTEAETLPGPVRESER